MIKLLTTCLFIFLGHNIYGQKPVETEETRVKSALNLIIPAHKKLCDSAKARIIFQWVSETFQYDYLLADTSPPLNQPENWNKITRNIDTLFLTKKGVCNGISYLYYLLCKQAGLQVLDVLGEVKGYTKGDEFSFLMSYPHTWNLVYWNGNWHRIDCTWALASENKDKVDFYWFDTRPEDFILTHYAYDKSLNKDFEFVSKQQFQTLPYFGREYFDYFQAKNLMVSKYLNEKSSAQIFFSNPKKNVTPYLQKMKSCKSSFERSKNPLLAFSDELWQQVDATRNGCFSIAVKVKEVEISNDSGFEYEMETIN
ncbi:MAG TPA: transglutaminase domain-containing protein, partial [Methanosarcina sp.]|nr:transglutaminase domain-containing protein [Methanosarcina sp.]